MEPDITAEYDRLMEELQKAAEADPHGAKAEGLRLQVEAFLRQHIGSTVAPAAVPDVPGSRTTH